MYIIITIIKAVPCNSSFSLPIFVIVIVHGHEVSMCYSVPNPEGFPVTWYRLKINCYILSTTYHIQVQNTCYRYNWCDLSPTWEQLPVVEEYTISLELVCAPLNIAPGAGCLWRLLDQTQLYGQLRGSTVSTHQDSALGERRRDNY